MMALKHFAPSDLRVAEIAGGEEMARKIKPLYVSFPDATWLQLHRRWSNKIGLKCVRFPSEDKTTQRKQTEEMPLKVSIAKVCGEPNHERTTQSRRYAKDAGTRPNKEQSSK